MKKILLLGKKKALSSSLTSRTEDREEKTRKKDGIKRKGCLTFLHRRVVFSPVGAADGRRREEGGMMIHHSRGEKALKNPTSLGLI